ncbi:MAG TPA: hypothetical protein PKA17_07770, partial [Phenylobacterium sp.]|nr:hypothetical protein [Phenylobacterium sp.]
AYMAAMPCDAVLRLLRAPLRDENFRRLIVFLSSWQFAVNLASPFFTVYFVSQLNYPITFVIVLSVVSQAANIAVLRTWGQLSDRFSNKSVLHVAARPTFSASPPRRSPPRSTTGSWPRPISSVCMWPSGPPPPGWAWPR